MLAEVDRIHSKADLKEWLDYELTKYGSKRLLDFLCLSERSILRRHIILLRKMEYYTNSGKHIRSILYKLLLRQIQNRYGLHISPNCCGKGLHIMHVGPILINGEATVGRDCVFHINSGVVAGGTSHDVPCLGDGVIVGFGAVVLGNTYVANGVAIGANAVVNKSVVEEHIAVAGVPARKISDNGSREWGKPRKILTAENND